MIKTITANVRCTTEGFDAENTSNQGLELDDFLDFDDLMTHVRTEVIRDNPLADAEDFDEDDLEFEWTLEGAPDDTQDLDDPGLWDFVALDDDDQQIVLWYVENVGWDGDIEEARDCFHGEWNDGGEFAQHIAEETESVATADWIVVDWDASWDRNLRHDYFEVDTDSGKVAIFRHV